ncbi:MAG: hypothetical protein ACFCU4_01510 [Puniceicoccaceae bacterium]
MSLPKILIIAGLFFSVGSVLFWAAGGFHMGWSQNRVPIQKVDPITEIEFTEYEERFVAGLEIVVAGNIIGDLLLLSGIVLFKKRKNNL